MDSSGAVAADGHAVGTAVEQPKATIQPNKSPGRQESRAALPKLSFFGISTPPVISAAVSGAIKFHCSDHLSCSTSS